MWCVHSRTGEEDPITISIFVFEGDLAVSIEMRSHIGLRIENKTKNQTKRFSMDGLANFYSEWKEYK